MSKLHDSRTIPARPCLIDEASWSGFVQWLRHFSKKEEYYWLVMGAAVLVAVVTILVALFYQVR